MGNHSSSHVAHKSRKNVHWKSAGRPGVPGKPEIIPFLSDEELNAITLKWHPPSHDGGAPLRGYQVECNRLGSPDWVRTAPPVVWRPELLLSGLEPPHRYQFRVTAINAVGRSDYSELSDILTVNANRTSQEPPLFLQHLENVTALENDKTEFRVSFTGVPVPTIAWFKDDYEIFSSRRTAISTTDSTSILIFHQTIASDEGEIKCTATNRAGHAVSKGRLSLEAAPKLRYPRQYEDGLLYEINETVFLKTTIVGKPTPVVEWRHDGQPISVNERIQITTTPKFSMLKILSARRSDRGEYQVHAKNNIGEDTAAFLVTITAPPDPPRNVSVARQVDKSVTLNWEPPEDDGGCRIGNYVVEYYRSGWNVWLKAVTSRKTSITLFDLIEGSEYRFRVKAESPYGMSAPSVESTPVKIPGRPVDMEFLAVESKIINEVMIKEEGEAMPISPTPRRKRLSAPADSTLLNEPSPVPLRKKPAPSKSDATSNEFMLVLYPDAKSDDKTEKRKSFQLDLEDALSPPPISLSAPELSSRSTLPFKTLRNAVSSTELLHERAMARFYKAVAMKEEQSKQKQNNIPSNGFENNTAVNGHTFKLKHDIVKKAPSADMSIKSDSVEEKELQNSKFQIRQDSINSEKWQQMSFDEDYTASTVSTDGDYSEDEDVSLTEEIQRDSQLLEEEATYNPRNKNIHNTSLSKESLEEKDNNDEYIPLSPLPDPNFVPKPILKKRENTEPINFTSIETKSDLKEGKEILTKTQKENKRTLFQKFTKQKPFHFPKILNKKDTSISQETIQTNKEKSVNKVEAIDDKFGDEGKTVIDYYGNIVKEYGSAKKSNTPLYLNTEDLKHVAEQQHKNDIQSSNVSEHKDKVLEPAQDKKVKTSKTKSKLRTKPLNKSSKKENLEKQSEKTENKIHLSKAQNSNQKSEIKNVVLKTTERATIVIPIDYRKLEERAKVTVRSAIDYTVDVCLLLLAFWLYIFKDERLAIPILILIIYRQLQETIFRNIPEWIRHYTPQWLKKKTSHGSRCIRFISQFKIPRSDCVLPKNWRKVNDPKLCGIRDKGLVLGVYYNENVVGEGTILTASAQKFDEKCKGKLWNQLKLTPTPRLGEYRVFYDLDPVYGYVAVAGLGSECLAFNELEQLHESKEAIRIAAGIGTQALYKFKPSAIHVESFGDAEAAAEGASLATWRFQEYRSPKSEKVIPKPKLQLFDDCDFDGWKIGELKAESQNLARFLQEMPPNILNPTKFAKLAVDLLCELDINVEVKTQGWATSHEMGGFVAIGKSSLQPPLYVEISYYGANERTRPIVLIGKGVTFDSGSVDLKSSRALRHMRGDMAGAACVLAITRAAALLKLPVNIRGILPLCELMPSGKSPKFGDIVSSASGKSIHIRLPSREGRLLFADSLVYARNYWPKMILDIGTMSKELIYTLGGAACGCYTNSEELFCYAESASSQTGDRIWRMPLWKFYEERLKDCHVADLANTATNDYGDSPNCAAFLKQFVCDSQWMHFDTYNVSYTEGHDFTYLQKGMTGRPTRTIIELMYQLLGDAKL